MNKVIDFKPILCNFCAFILEPAIGNSLIKALTFTSGSEFLKKIGLALTLVRVLADYSDKLLISQHFKLLLVRFFKNLVPDLSDTVNSLLFAKDIFGVIRDHL